jgi:hypothetical protein
MVGVARRGEGVRMRIRTKAHRHLSVGVWEQTSVLPQRLLHLGPPLLLLVMVMVAAGGRHAPALLS